MNFEYKKVSEEIGAKPISSEIELPISNPILFNLRNHLNGY